MTRATIHNPCFNFMMPAINLVQSWRVDGKVGSFMGVFAHQPPDHLRIGDLFVWVELQVSRTMRVDDDLDFSETLSIMGGPQIQSNSRKDF